MPNHCNSILASKNICISRCLNEVVLKEKKILTERRFGVLYFEFLHALYINPQPPLRQSDHFLGRSNEVRKCVGETISWNLKNWQRPHTVGGCLVTDKTLTVRKWACRKIFLSTNAAAPQQTTEEKSIWIGGRWLKTWPKFTLVTHYSTVVGPAFLFEGLQNGGLCLVNFPQ